VENFLSGKGLPLTDVEFGKDGAMYLTVGGRGTQAALYRVRWMGEQPVAQAAATPPAQTPDTAATSRAYRRQHEDARAEIPQAQAIADLGSSDRSIRFAASRYWERKFSEQPQLADQVFSWIGEKEGEKFTPAVALTGLLAVTRAGEPALQPRVLEMLKAFPLSSLSDELKLLKLRVLTLAFARGGRPADEMVKMGLEKLIAQFPAKGDNAEKLNRELCQLLIWLSNPTLGDEHSPGTEPRKTSLGPVPNPGANLHADRKGASFHAEMGQQIIERTLKLMEAAPSQEEQILYALALRWAHGWTPQQREWYFRWFHEKADRYNGGNSFAKFVDRIRADAASRVPGEEQAALNPWLAPMASAQPQRPKAQDVKPREFVKAWTVADLEAELNALKDRKPDLARGKQLYAEAQCAQCHLFRDSGGNVGPDLTAVAQRFGRKDILEAIIDPNKVVSDQYAMVTLTVRKGGGGDEQVSGLVKEETSGTVTILTDPVAGKTAAYYENVIVKREKANVSIMPPALLFTLKAEEVADLLAYMGAK